MPRGGRRSGAPGKGYASRTDLNEVRTLPVQTAPGQPYGAAAAQKAAQQTVPMANGPTPPPIPAGAPAVAPQLPGPTPPPPGSAPPLIRPTTRPMEPVTAGAPIGPGPGPEALTPQGMAPQTLGQVLDRLAGANPDLAYLAAFANNGSR